MAEGVPGLRIHVVGPESELDAPERFARLQSRAQELVRLRAEYEAADVEVQKCREDLNRARQIQNDIGSVYLDKAKTMKALVPEAGSEAPVAIVCGEHVVVITSTANVVKAIKGLDDCVFPPGPGR